MNQATAEMDLNRAGPHADERAAERARVGIRDGVHDARRRTNGQGRGPQPEHDALASLLGQYLDALRSAVRSRAELFSLEAQRASDSATRLAVLGGVLLIVGGTGWLLLVTTVVLGMAAAGVPLLGALLIVLAVHVVAAIVAIGRIKRATEGFRFAATRRSLRDGLDKLSLHERHTSSAAPAPRVSTPAAAHAPAREGTHVES